MPLIGEINGECKNITLKEGDTMSALSIYTAKSVSGLKFETSAGQTLSLGDVTAKQHQTYRFEPNTLLVGFYGKRKEWKINSLGLIYLDPECFINLPMPEVKPKTVLGSLAALMTIIVLGVALIAATGTLICFYFRTKKHKPIKIQNKESPQKHAAEVLDDEDPDHESKL